MIGFSTMTCLPARSAASGQVVMRRDRSGDQHGVDGGVVDQRAWVLMQRKARIALASARQRRSREIGDAGKAAAVRLGDAAREVRPPIAVADDTDTDHGAAIPVAGVGRSSRSRTSPTTLAGTPATIA